MAWRFPKRLAALALLGAAACGPAREERGRELYLAVMTGEAETVRELLGREPALARGLKSAFTGQTPLHYAADAGIARALLDAGASPEARDTTGHTPLHAARRAEIVALLAERGARLDARAADGATPLHTAVYREVAEALLRLGAPPDARDELGRTPLFAHAAEDRLEVLSLLLERGADPRLAQTSTGRTPLHAAADRGFAAAASALLAAGADPSARDAAGLTPGELARNAGYLDLAKRLAQAPPPAARGERRAAAAGKPGPPPAR